MDRPKKVSHKQTKKLSRRKRRSYPKLFLILLILALISWGGLKLYHSPLFNIKKIKITGNHRVSASRILQLSQVAPGISLLKISPWQIRKTITTEPWIKNIQIIRHFPTTIELKVEERKPIANLVVLDYIFLIDDEQIVLERLPEKDGHLPVIKDVKTNGIEIGKPIRSDSLANAIICLKNLDASLRESVEEISAATIDDLSFVIRQGTKIIFGKSEEMTKKKYVLSAILSQAKINSQKIIYIDVRVVSNPVVKKIEN